jgi:four helix bundle protein
MSTEKKYDIGERCLEFAVRVAKYLNKVPNEMSAREYARQLIRSSASIGANLEEADGTLTKKDFINKMVISRKEAREIKYWLKLLQRTQDSINQEESNFLIQEAEEIKLIISSIINKTKEKHD